MSEAKIEDVWKNNKIIRKIPEKDEYYTWYEENKKDLEKSGELINIDNPGGFPVDEIMKIGDFTLFRCTETGFMFCNPRLKESAAKKFFAHGFLEEYYEEVEASFEKRKELGYKDVTEKIAGFLNKGDKVLEIGCGTGPKLRILRDEYGFEVDGLEISPIASKYHEKHNLNVQIESIESFEAEDEHYDCVFMWSVADHFADPMAAFKKCADLLKPGGTFLMASINTDGFDHAITGLDNVAYRPPNRVNFYNIRSLKFQIELAGLNIIESYTPGKLDVAMVKDYWNNGGQNGRNHFLENLIVDSNQNITEKFQEFLSNNSLSGYQIIVAQKKL